jgi:hypothetical protein
VSAPQGSDVTAAVWLSLFRGFIAETEELTDKWLQNVWGLAATRDVRIVIEHNGRLLVLDSSFAREFNFRDMEDLEVEIAWQRLLEAAEPGEEVAHGKGAGDE